MANLYEVDYRLETLLEEGFDVDTGEILEGNDLNKAFDDVAIELDTKISNTIGFIKNLESDAKALKEESDNLKKRAQQCQKKADWLRSYLDGYFKATVKDIKGYKFESTQGKISYRKSDKVEVTNIDLLPKEYIKEKIEVSADKTAIKDAIKNGAEINGAHIETNLNMQIK